MRTVRPQIFWRAKMSRSSKRSLERSSKGSLERSLKNSAEKQGYGATFAPNFSPSTIGVLSVLETNAASVSTIVRRRSYSHGYRRISENFGNSKTAQCAFQPKTCVPPKLLVRRREPSPLFSFQNFVGQREATSNRRDTEDTNTNSNNSSPIDERRSGVHH